ncbi:D-alanyl-D-alanine carboxypeptidase / D-alanyl-D-alanine-endopeptidase (penicillin-binding protein 4) [Duganella sp. CF458]|uniref:D-alanyl-D-alanine carboxypeptidase/D-alanyl-D-alanine endopeptidase n=1 Tax=Duganella sp. CF458 TaxID=1884368 RepID=UPI0008E61AB0|nr:D-alanyl-D-alanine carboxypeptidase/D-alanyl-D-alanine-endopeptidase [Duganella sp. CF458]SFF62078.1 D-alanyl-D-alanine carboxypeptidase / D-alanyl-D-alanine-endopeptidase (penicillin-binding protein 4) [Duganella sp. CF458]
MRRLLLATLFGAIGACAQAALPEPIARLAAEKGIPQDAIGAVVLRGDQVLVAHEAARTFTAASTMKLFTTLVGLEVLGPQFRGRTELRTSGEVAGGVLHGDLVLRGGADGDFTADAFTHMLEKLRTKGIRQIDGNLVLDRQLWQPARADAGAAPFDESPEAYYNLIPDALLLNMNLQTLDISSDAKSIKASVLPELDKVRVRSELALVDRDCARWEDGWKIPEYVRDGAYLTVVLKGTFPRNCSKTNVINVLDRTDYAERLFRATWERLGGQFNGQASEASAEQSRAFNSGASTLLAEHVSRSLPEMVRDTNKLSDNGLARTIFLSLGSLQADPVQGSRPLPDAAPMEIPGGAEAAPAPMTTNARAEMVIRNWLRAHGIDDTGMVFENGSGLSRIERFSPEQMAGLLKAAQKSLWAPEFLTSLPIAAIDGTMRRRLKDSPAAMQARIKTGSLKNVVAIAGYVPDASGQQCVVVVMVNHDRAGNGNGRALADGLIDWVARSGGQQ